MVGNREQVQSGAASSTIYVERAVTVTANTSRRWKNICYGGTFESMWRLRRSHGAGAQFRHRLSSFLAIRERAVRKEQVGCPGGQFPSRKIVINWPS